MGLPMIHGAAELDALVREIGFLPLFRSNIPGFSVEDLTPRDRWFVKGVEGPWEWREALADSGQIAYAKVFDKKAGLIAPECYPDFANLRRDGHDFIDRYEQGRCSRNEKLLFDLLAVGGATLSGDLKARSGMVKGFDTAIASLQMRTDVTIRRLEYKRDRFGRPYGWGEARFQLSDDAFGEAFVRSRFDETPDSSYQRLRDRVAALFPHASERDIASLLRY